MKTLASDAIVDDEKGARDDRELMLAILSRILVFYLSKDASSVSSIHFPLVHTINIICKDSWGDDENTRYDRYFYEAH